MTICFTPTRTVATLIICLMCSGCTAAQTAPNVQQATPSSALQFACADHANMNGRISINYTISGQQEAIHGKFNWAQTSEQTVITLLTPLGQTFARINIEPNISTLSIAGQAPRSAPNIQELISRSLGWDLPVTGMKTWLQGCAVDQSGNNVVASSSLSKINTIQGWEIDYIEWTQYQGKNLPKRINLSKKNIDNESLDIQIRLVIDNWENE